MYFPSRLLFHESSRILELQYNLLGFVCSPQQFSRLGDYQIGLQNKAFRFCVRDYLST